MIAEPVPLLSTSSFQYPVVAFEFGIRVCESLVQLVERIPAERFN